MNENIRHRRQIQEFNMEIIGITKKGTEKEIIIKEILEENNP